MKILYYDCFAGVSGDMNLAAMLDLGVAPELLRAELAKLGLENEFALEIVEDSRCGIYGTRVNVRLLDGHVAKGHRNLATIEKIIMDSTLDQAIKDTSLSIFRKVAVVEAKIHGKAIEDVHFHEVGATDSIVDIVGAAICRHHLEVDAVWSSPIELGGGFVRCAHGLMPVPAPATAEILHGAPTSRGAVPHEATTPTGAAIMATLADTFTQRPRMVVEKTAYGIGHREAELPNVLRVHLASVVQENKDLGSEDVRLLQCNIDDMTAEMLGDVMDFFMEKGAMDVHFTPIMMKKNRPATMISVLCSAEDAQFYTKLLFQHTTTLGVKVFPLEKITLERRFERVETPFGAITMKHALLDGEILRSKPEFEECKEIARKNNIPLAAVYAAIHKDRK